jgi:hypothetical protein
MSAAEEVLPQPPLITEDDLRKCRESGDYCPVLFEWYKYVGILCNIFAYIRPESPSLKGVPAAHFSVLVGLLNRAARLMHSNVALSHEGLFGETTGIIDRCIFESCVKVSWLCLKGNDEAFSRYIAEGLKTELEFKKKINENVNARGGAVLAIEKQMLASIDRCIVGSGLSERQIDAAKKLPDMAAMIDQLGHDRLTYVVGQRIGSHHVHGTWPSLRMHYLEEDKSGYWLPRSHNCPTHVNQYVFVAFVVLAALDSFFIFVYQDVSDLEIFSNLLKSVRTEIETINAEVIGKDFDHAGI